MDELGRRMRHDRGAQGPDRCISASDQEELNLKILDAGLYTVVDDDCSFGYRIANGSGGRRRVAGQ
jgi:hypothetical protein